MAELLFELFSEEIPARMQARAAEDLQRLVSDGLKATGLDWEGAATYVTPRRLVLTLDGLPTQAPDIRGERKGPNVNAPEQAVDGFKRSLPAGAVIEEREAKKGSIYFATWEEKGRATADILEDVLPRAVQDLPWPKSMRWGRHSQRWVRPLHAIVALFDGAVIPFACGPVSSGSVTYGHRFMAPEPITVAGVSDYLDKMRAAKVLLDREERKEIVARDALILASKQGLVLKPDAGLLEEVAGLVEWPVVLMGEIPEEFMEVPEEVLTLSMRSHQKYFSCLNPDGRLAPRFVVVANRETPDGGRQIVAGNERVLKARLSDARYFWQQDHKKTLEERIPDLDDMVFHAKMGSMRAKTQRVAELAVALCKYVPGADEDMVFQAARLSKSDLMCEMVYEFPEVQGIMGRYLALDQGLDPQIARAVEEHYAPLGPNDTCPTAPVSVAVALADKIDTLVGFWGIGETPTGSKDPFALRRAALGVIRLIVENGLRVPLFTAFNVSASWHAEIDPPIPPNGLPDLLDFFADRLKVHLRSQGVRHDLIAAVFALGGESDLVRLLARVEALSSFLDSDDGANLLIAYRRAANIVRIEENKDGRSYGDAVEPELLVQGEERILAETLDKVAAAVDKSLKDEDFEKAMTALALLRRPVDAFFDHVTVNCSEVAVRGNRLRLLSGIGAAMGCVADFSHVEG